MFWTCTYAKMSNDFRWNHKFLVFAHICWKPASVTYPLHGWLFVLSVYIVTSQFLHHNTYDDEFGLHMWPEVTDWLDSLSPWQVKQITGEDRARLYYNLMHSRRQIIDANMLKKPLEQGGNFIVSTLRR